MVPDLVSASTRSYRRPIGASEAGKASVSPCPAPSRSAAYAWAMNHEVPQPTTATRSPLAGRASEEDSPAARLQQAGWDAISVSV